MIKIDYQIKQKSSRTIFLRIKVISTLLINDSKLKFFSKGLKEEKNYTYVYSTWLRRVEQVEPIAKIVNNPNLAVLYVKHSNETIQNIVKDVLRMLD